MMDWEDIRKRVNPELSEKYGFLRLNPKPDCKECNGTGISTHTYNCGASNCKGHNDIICSCTHLEMECPYLSEHPRVYGNWHTIYKEGKIYLECYNVESHANNSKAQKGERLQGRIKTVMFELGDQ